VGGRILEVVDDLGLGKLAGDVEVAREPEGLGDGRKERIDRARADLGEHRFAFGVGFWEVSHIFVLTWCLEGARNPAIPAVLSFFARLG
jgi:hypothetical protein